MSFIKKENLTIVIGEYEKDGAMKKQYKTIGEIITMQGNDGPYQFFKLWGPGGVVEGKVFSQDDNKAQQSQQPRQQQQPPQQNYQQQPQQQGGYAVNSNQPPPHYNNQG